MSRGVGGRVASHLNARARGVSALERGDAGAWARSTPV
jgi:hypothetical protein